MGVHGRGDREPALQLGAVSVAGPHDPEAPRGQVLRQVGAELALCRLVGCGGGQLWVEGSGGGMVWLKLDGEKMGYKLGVGYV